MNIKEAGFQLADIINKFDAEYIDVHLEESQSSSITYRGKDLESVDKTSSVGGNIRALVKGGWGFVSFNSLTDLETKANQAFDQARFVSGGDAKINPDKAITDSLINYVKANPVNIPLSQKKQILDEYNEIIWSTPKLQTSVIGYGDGYKKYLYINSAGSFIEQERADVTLRTTAIAADGGEVQQVGLSLGSLGDFNQIKGLHDQMKEMSSERWKCCLPPRPKGESTPWCWTPFWPGFSSMRLSVIYPKPTTSMKILN